MRFGTRMWGYGAAIAVLVSFVILILAEAASQVYSVVLYRNWEALKQDSGHYYQASRVEGLAYELRRPYSLRKDDRFLAINSYGIRDARSDFAPGRKVGLFGDSVTFGTNHSQEDTISALLETRFAEAGSDVVVLNAGVPGYNALEVLTRIRDLLTILEFDEIVYILHPNDFAIRETVYEGADNGLYRMYRKPRLKLPWMVRKAIYRYQKGGGASSVEWYGWMYDGGKDEVLRAIESMAEELSRSEVNFSVLILPAGVAYSDNDYELSWMDQEIVESLSESGVRVRSMSELLPPGREAYFDSTDHLTVAGNEYVADVLMNELSNEGNESR